MALTHTGLSESDTRAKLIDPAIHASGWTEDLIRREETAGAIEIIDGRPRKQAQGRIDYTLRIKVCADDPACRRRADRGKAGELPPGHGLEQAKLYAACKRLNVPFVFSSNGHLFVEFDRFTGLTHAPRQLTEFPTPHDLQARYEQGMGFALATPPPRRCSPATTAARATAATTRTPPSGLSWRRWRAASERAGPSALLSLATGAGKTFIAVNLLKRIADAGQLKRALFVCDRDELRIQGTRRAPERVRRRRRRV